ncbi:Gx transporter family protein [Raoultibacter phocaeensis]|uniref:Gx transporter family protein n=1 Tax=Raoultibacter phocaeensis TaxID=2479841 RepID=UPI00111A05E7|nr:Gx transporter family protein [Raoultibacter phocaeensis]
MSEKSKHLAYIALFVALTVVLGYLEAMIPVPVAIPGVKLGLANVAVLIALYVMGPRWAFAVMLLKVGVTSLIVGAPSMALYSLAGSTLAYLGMLAAWRFGRFSLVVVSVIAALLHNLGQMGVAIAVMQTTALLVNLPVMVIAACITGVATGTIALGVLKAIPAVKGAADSKKAAGKDSGRLAERHAAAIAGKRPSDELRTAALASEALPERQTAAVASKRF